VQFTLLLKKLIIGARFPNNPIEIPCISLPIINHYTLFIKV